MYVVFVLNAECTLNIWYECVCFMTIVCVQPVCTFRLPFIYGACVVHVGYPVRISWVLRPCGVWVPHCTYLGYHVNVVVPSRCSIRFTSPSATCTLRAYPACCTCTLCATWGVRAHAPCVLCVNCCVCVGHVCVHVLSSDSSARASRVQVAIQILDENDNAPQLAEPYDTFVCDSAAPGQVSQGGRGLGT